MYGEFWRGILERFEEFGRLPHSALTRPGQAPYSIPVVNGVAIFPWRYGRTGGEDLAATPFVTSDARSEMFALGGVSMQRELNLGLPGPGLTPEEQELAEVVEAAISDALVTAGKVVVVAISSSPMGLHAMSWGEVAVTGDGCLEWGFFENLMEVAAFGPAGAVGTRKTFTAGDPPAKVIRLREIARAFDPARLTQARVLAELTKGELADELGVSAAAVGQYEAGATKPRSELLPELSHILKVPVQFFAAGRPLGRLDAADAHFRSLRSTRAKDRAKAATHAEQLWELTYALEKRVRLPDADLPAMLAGATPVQAAQILRRSWGIGRGPVPHLVATMESRGIVVSLIPMTNESVGRVSAYSTDALGRPLVIVTPERARSIYRYRFTCAHELGHLLLHVSPLPGDRQQEREADEFAAELLTPRA